VDYNDKIVASGIPGIQIRHSHDLQAIKNQGFDLIIASAIIEHIPYPADSLAIMFSCLNQEGFFYARTPYVLPLLKAAQHVGISLDFTYPSHLHDLGPEFWDNIILELGINGNFTIKSQPSMVETTFRESIPRAILTYLLKFPWRFFPRSYKYIGGWEIFIKKEKEKNR
jgi:SAM-dependent methyltransferase